MRERLLTRHFLQRFLENDLVSPDADRHETIALAGAVLLSGGLFVTSVLALKFLFMPFQSPGRTAMLALDDRLLFITVAMIVMAVVAVVTWDGLSLDPRDTAILGPLPIAHHVIVRAKLRAVAMFAGAFSLAITACPSVVHPPLLVARLRIGLAGGVFVMIVQAGVLLAAGLFGFATILALREGLRAALGGVLFHRVSNVVQGLLTVGLVTSFLLLPAIVPGATHSSLKNAAPARLLPPFWFLGLQETIAGGTVESLPRPDLPEGLEKQERTETANYRSHRAQFRALAAVGALALPGVLGLAVAGYFWNTRRLPLPIVGQLAPHRHGVGLVARLAMLTVVRAPVAQAGFFFAMKCLFRSASHRLAVAGCTAVALAIATVMLRIGAGSGIRDVAAMPLSIFATQTTVLAVMLGGFRHAVRIPADLRANRLFQLAWAGQRRRYLDGVNRGALAALIVPAVMALLPIHIYAMGPRLALMHLLSGLLLGAATLEALSFRGSMLPFASSYLPPRDLNTRGPIVAIALMFAISNLSKLERAALARPRGALMFWGVLLGLAVGLRAWDGWTARATDAQQPIDFHAPEMARLDLGSS